MTMHGPKIQKDLFGLVLNNFLHGYKTSYSMVRDDGYVDYPENPAAYFHVDAWYQKYAKGKILDVGCGSGSYMLAFEKKSHETHGIDIDANCVRTCRERGVKNVWQENILMPNRTKQHHYDTVLLAGNNLGIAGNLENLKKMLQYFHSITAENGIIIGEGSNVTKTTKAIHKQYQIRQRKMGRYPGIVTIRVDYKNLVGEWFDWVHVPQHKFSSLAKETRWKVELVEAKGESNYFFILRKQA